MAEDRDSRDSDRGAAAAKRREALALKSRVQTLMGRVSISNPSQLADRAGVSTGAWLRFWRGETEWPRRGTLESIAGALGVSLAQLVGDEPLASPPDTAVEVTLMIDGDDFDVYQAVAILRREQPTDVIEGEVAVGARRLETEEAVRDVLASVRQAREREPEG